jgi:biotin carboxyl carrier protein
VAAARGVVHSILVKPGQTVRAGDLVMAIEEV